MRNMREQKYFWMGFFVCWSERWLFYIWFMLQVLDSLLAVSLDRGQSKLRPITLCCSFSSCVSIFMWCFLQSREIFNPWICCYLHRAWREHNKCMYENIWVLALLSQHRAQTSLVPPHEVMTLTSGLVALGRIMSIARSSIWAECEAEASRAVADFEQTIWAEEGFSFASSQVVNCLQIIVDSNVSQLFPALLCPPSPHEDNTHHQNQQQDSQYAGDGDGGRGMVGSLA